MKPNHPLRALGRTVVASLPKPVSEALRGAKRSLLNQRQASDVFRRIYKNNEWDGTESISGPGSTLAATTGPRAVLPGLIEQLGVHTLLDIPCGDAHWISTCLPEGVAYIGGDIVPELVERNRRTCASFGTFAVLDLVSDELPRADLLLVRDCFIHLPNAMVRKAIANIRRAPITYLLTTTFPNETTLTDIELGGYRPINLTLREFGLPPPLLVSLDEDGVRANGKSLGLWRVGEI